MELDSRCVLCYFDQMPEDVELIDSWQPPDDPIVGLTERERRFGTAYFEVALQHGDHSGSLLLAYRRAFPLANNTDHSAHMLARGLIKSPRVQILVTRLRENLAARAVVPATQVLVELERVAYANIMDYTTVDPNSGELRVDMRRLTPVTAAAVSELNIDETYNPNTGVTKRRVRLKMHAKLSALDALARVHGLYQDFNSSWSLDQIDRHIQRIERQLEERGVRVIEHEQ